MKDFRIGNKMVGTLSDGVFYKLVNKSKHFMRIYDAWGIDKEVLNQLPKETKMLLTDKKLQMS
jgi:hypothetical protein